MTKTIGLREANQAFSVCVRAVEAGEDYVITRNGTAVARLIPVDGRRVPTAEQVAALQRLKGWAAAGDGLDLETFDRDALHER